MDIIVRNISTNSQSRFVSLVTNFKCLFLLVSKLFVTGECCWSVSQLLHPGPVDQDLERKQQNMLTVHHSIDESLFMAHSLGEIKPFLTLMLSD